MRITLLLSLSLSALVLPLFAAAPCPICGGELTTVGEVTDDPSKPNKNDLVWRLSKSCGLALVGEDSPFCKRCWVVQEDDDPVTWMRGSELPDSFRIPLSAAIRNFPVPPKSASYDQLFIDGKRTDSLYFSCENSTEMIARFRGYCKKHQLSIKVIEFSEDVGVWVEAPEAQQGGADQPATAPEPKPEGKKNAKPASEVRPQ